MATVMKTRIVRIGNSQGVRIPKTLLEQSGLSDEVELALQQDQIVIRPAYHPRHNWEDQFKLMAKRGDDRLLDGELPPLTTWDEEDWQW